jgi:RNA recognition motif-containing protein
VKPLDYSKLRAEKQMKGVIFLSKPPKDYCSKEKLINFLSPYGGITRIQEDYKVRGKKKYLNGFYIEFEKKSIAKRVALTLNMTNINSRDSRVLQFKYVPNFDWTELEEEDALEKMKKKLLIAEAEKELREVKLYGTYKKW